MPEAIGLVKAIKRAAVEAVNASKPVNIYFGKVISDTPLQIYVEQKMILTSAQLILPRNVTDYTTHISTLDDSVERREITVHNHLMVGDEVILVRQQEGQKYIVIDRIGGDAT